MIDDDHTNKVLNTGASSVEGHSGSTAAVIAVVARRCWYQFICCLLAKQREEGLEAGI
jgi:cysteine synthase